MNQETAALPAEFTETVHPVIGEADDSVLPFTGVRRILIVTDAWHPQVNGVVRTMERVAENLPAFGAEAVLLTPVGFRSVPMPTYPDIRLALATPGQIRRRMAAASADHVHIVTEGPLGLIARSICLRQRPRVHHQLSHALPRISERPAAGP